MYCRRLGLQVPVAVSVRKSQMADVFHVICGIAIRPCVIVSRIRSSIKTDLTSLIAPPLCQAAQSVVLRQRHVSGHSWLSSSGGCLLAFSCGHYGDKMERLGLWGSGYDGCSLDGNS